MSSLLFCPLPDNDHGATETWTVDLPSHIRNGELVVPPGMYFMMGDHRHGSLDSRYWGFAPRENIMGRPLFNYWSFETPETNHDKTGIGNSVAWMGPCGCCISLPELAGSEPCIRRDKPGSLEIGVRCLFP